jgi:RHS repeat-associated protein
VLTRALGNTAVETFTYNDRLHVTNISATLSATTLMNLSYNYGTTINTGRVLSRTDAIQPEHTAAYTYDGLYRLQQVAEPGNTWSIAWTFDNWGNRLTQTPTGLATTRAGTQTLGYTNNRLNTYSYDLAGNQTTDGSHTYGFNAENQMVSMDGGAATYAYDGEDRRMKRTVGSETTYYFYGPGGILCEFSTSNAISSATAASSSDKTYYHTTDKLGSAVLVINSAGTVIENNRTLPYGEMWIPENAPSTNDKKFTTYLRDAESNLDYAMARYYASRMGRFISADPSDSAEEHDPQTWNLYTYVNNDPINFTDPTGLVRCGDIPVGPTGGTLSSNFNARGEFNALARFLWNEQRNYRGADTGREHGLMAQAVMNRVDLVAGRVAVQGERGTGFWGNGGFEGSPYIRGNGGSVIGTWHRATELIGSVGNGSFYDILHYASNYGAGRYSMDSNGNLTSSSASGVLNRDIGDTTRRNGNNTYAFPAVGR